MISKFELGYYKAYADSQTFEFAQPNDGIGLNVLVGPNNTGKSTPLTALSRLFSDNSDLNIDFFDLHDHAPVIKAYFNTLVATFELSAQGKSGSSYLTKAMTRDSAGIAFQPDAAKFLKSIPARRNWSDAFSHASMVNVFGFERAQLSPPENQPTQLGQQLRELIREGKKSEFNSFICRILPNHIDWDISHINGQDFIVYEPVSGKKHRVSLLGEGFLSIFRVAYTLFNSAPGDTILLDEPELSLHPQAQKLLRKEILALATDRQIILATHSPHLFSWKDLENGAKLYRVYQNASGNAEICRPSAATMNEISKIAASEIKNRKLYDIVSREIFFGDKIVFLEGQEDLHLIENYLETTQQNALPLFGYGSGGAPHIERWLKLASELKLTAVGVYDGDQTEKAEHIKKTYEAHDNITILTLPRDDIRDKHLRDGKCADTGTCKESNEIVKEGFFRRDWTLKPELADEFQAFIDQIRAALH